MCMPIHALKTLIRSSKWTNANQVITWSLRVMKEAYIDIMCARSMLTVVLNSISGGAEAKASLCVS